MKHVVLGVLLGVVAIALLPAMLHAWTPGTHIFLGESVLVNLDLLTVPMAELLRTFPFDFLYGNIAADTSIAKKYAPVGRHCHAWHVGQEIYDLADQEQVRAFGLGYLSHLAADVIAHNFFVPRQLVITSSTSALGHSYWESRIDVHLGESYTRTARELILMDHSVSDEHLDSIISPTIFSVSTNRRIFRGMVHLIDTTSWQRAFQIVAENSRWDLPDEDVERFMGYAFDAVMETLTTNDGDLRRLDPAGETSLRRAKKMRRELLRAGGRTAPERLREAAEKHFGLPQRKLTFWTTSRGHRPRSTTPTNGSATTPAPPSDPPSPARPS